MAKTKSNAVVSTTVTNDGVIHITVLGAGKVEFDPNQCQADMRKHAELHGWIQRLADGAAKSRDSKTGLPATPADKLAAIQTIADYYLKGATEWKMKGSGGGRMPMSELILEALCRVNDIPLETMRERINRMAEVKGTKAATLLATLGTQKDVAAMVLTIQAERAASTGIDAEDLMADLMED